MEDEFPALYHWVGATIIFGFWIWAAGRDTPYVMVGGHSYWNGDLVLAIVTAVFFFTFMWTAASRRY